MDQKYSNYISLIQAQVPELELLQVEVNNNGWDHLVFIINHEWVFRFPRTAEFTQRVEQEQKLLHYLYNRTRMSKIQIPQYQLLHSQNNQVVGCYYRMIPGTPLTPTLLKYMNYQTRNNIAKQLGTFLRNLHTSNIDFLQALGFRTLHTRGYWENQFRDIKDFILPLLTVDERLHVIDIFQTYLSEDNYNHVQKTLVHGDLSFTHILYSPKQQVVTGIIDFGDAQLTDPAYDFSGLYWDYGKEFVQEVLINYKHPQTNSDPLFYRVEHFFGKRPIFHEILHGIKHQEGKLLKESLNALRSWIGQEKDHT